MENYQLYRTNPLLSGQVKWNLIVDNIDGELKVSNLHLSTINDKYFDKRSEENLFLYTHQENIKNFYKKTKGVFYETPGNPDLYTDWPIVKHSNNEIIKPYDDIYISGCNRISYKIYEKQLEYLCPLWLECVKESENLQFVFEMKDSNNRIINSKTLNISNDSRFGKYLYDYLKYVNIEKGNDKVIKINLNSKTAYIQGVEVTSGNFVTKNISNLTLNLLNRERPVMETDGMIIDSFSSNNLISSQLFNFNLIFNLEDIFPGYGNTYNISVSAKIKDKYLDKKDFYTNYEFIPKEICYKHDVSIFNSISYPPVNNKKSVLINILDYLKDNYYINLINKNKLIQKYIHWSLSSNNEYIFNLYEGFSGLDEEGNKYLHRYGCAPDLYSYKYSDKKNNLNWCTYYGYLNQQDINNLKNRIPNYKLVYEQNPDFNKYITEFPNDWINRVQYKRTDQNNDEKIICGTVCLNGELEYDKYIKIADSLYAYVDTSPRVVLFISENKNKLTFANVKYQLSKYTEKSINDKDKTVVKVLTDLTDYINKVIYPPLIIFNHGLDISKADSPSLSSKEITYYKNNNINIQLERYDGNIKPTFINGLNYFYFKEIIEKNNNDRLQYVNSNFLPLYKSIGFFYIKNKELKDENYYAIFNNYLTQYEYKWFGVSKVINLFSNYETAVEDLNDVDKCLSDLYSLNGDNDKINFIKQLYNIQYDEINNIKKIKLSLK